MLSTLHPDRRRLLGQLARFVVSGAFVTASGVGVYAVVALLLRWHPQIRNFMGYVVDFVTSESLDRGAQELTRPEREQLEELLQARLGDE